MRAGWLTPDVLPAGLRTCVLRFPDSEDWAALVRGCLLLLSEERNFEAFGDVSVALTADTFRQTLFDFLKEDCVMFPIGGCLDWPSNTIPPNFLDTNQGAVSRTTYAELFAVVGTVWGIGDGITTFDLPHKDGRVTVGKKDSGTIFNTLGAAGGEVVHTLSVSEMPAHNHDALAASGAGGFATRYAPGVNTGSTSTSIIQQRGGGQAHNNMPPYVVMNYIIRCF